MKLTQDQWDFIFDYACSLLLAAICAAFFWWFAMYWLIVPYVHYYAFTWSREFPKAKSS